MRPFSNLQNDPRPRFLCCETIFIMGMVNLIFRWRFPLEISVAFYAVLVLSARHFRARIFRGKVSGSNLIETKKALVSNF